MTELVSAVNFIRHHGLFCRQFKTFLYEIGSEYDDIAYILKFFLPEKNNQTVDLKMQVGYVIWHPSQLNDRNSQLQTKFQTVSQIYNVSEWNYQHFILTF
jgi:hypothetical protein